MDEAQNEITRKGKSEHDGSYKFDRIGLYVNWHVSVKGGTLLQY